MLEFFTPYYLDEQTKVFTLATGNANVPIGIVFFPEHMDVLDVLVVKLLCHYSV